MAQGCVHRRRMQLQAAGRRTPKATAHLLLTSVKCLVLLSWGCGGAPQPAPAAPATQPAGGPPHWLSSERLLRVLLREGQDEYLLSLEGPFDVIEPQTGRLLGASPRGAIVQVRFAQEGILLSIPPLNSPGQAIDLLPRDLGPVGLYHGAALRRYRGWLRLARTSDTTGCVINLVDVEDYLPAVVAAELDRRFHPETFKAQAIAARTYAWYQKGTVGRSQLWDLTATQRSQVYGDLSRSREVTAAEEAVRATEGLVCTWESPEGPRIFCSYYSSLCGGQTQSADAIRRRSAIPPLAGDVPCPCCQNRSDCDWEPVRLPKNALSDLLRGQSSRLRELGMIVRVEVAAATPGGRPVLIVLRDDTGRSFELEAENFRLMIDPSGRLLRSTLFTLTDAGEDVIVEHGRGFGHGVGLCQYGAEILAEQGLAAGQILRHYYPGVRLSRAY